MIKAFRISKTSFKPWQLHGPVDQALKTTIQADAVRVIPVGVSIGELDLALEMWIDASVESQHGPNGPATTVLAVADARKKGQPLPTITLVEDVLNNVQTWVGAVEIDTDEIPLVRGAAILTGPGASDVPDCYAEGLVQALMGAI